VRCGLSPIGANCRALVVVILLVVPAVSFFAEVGVLTSIDMGNVDSLFQFKFMEAMCSV
jgi:hypothetical protein